MQHLTTKNQFQLLRERCIADSTRVFSARGKSVVRCEQCQLAAYACICDWQPQLQSHVEFVLLLHRIEIFKPTNTGRLIADLFPRTHAYCWSRTEPDQALLDLLQDENRQCFIVFPADTPEAKAKPREVFSEVPDNNKIKTFILLDATWKQSSRMFHLSRWLESVPCISLPQGALRGYAVRKSHQEDYLSTAEAAALCLQMAGENTNSERLLDYFQLFNEHYLATRGCYPPIVGELHERLAALKMPA
ncbi:DTW domain-containing protein [Cellvibrio zantedeschiae]|uniref:tRNA-uridine aminocarboxypropyltransferase n=1 Tax=Cellvibrio zantedeschiae TaxID=1237077 RepID=A0ABQ3B5J0_9GAMM|nr:DTW domain-containing protein [Cellvibrio zantedeschiae]GGY74148.1 DTW domain-containing protein [Cellvibrio zantedeschiae]